MGTSAGFEERRWRVAGWLFTWALLAGCTGRIGSLDETAPGGSRAPGTGRGGGAGVGAGVGGGGSGNTLGDASTSPPPTPARDPTEAGYAPTEQGATDRPAPATRFARLTHVQWANTVTDLLHVTNAASVAADFRSDPAQQGFLFDDNALALQVDDALWASYQRAAADIAANVTSNPALLSQILPADGGDPEARARTFITEFGRKAFRRPLSDAEAEQYLGIYRSGAGAYAGLSDFDAGIRLLLEGFLQSPRFLYRIEASTTATSDVIPLDAYEIASRLSFTLWNTMPDAELFRAASAGELVRADRVAEQAARLLEDRRAEDVIAKFHSELLNTEHYSVISPAPAFFPNAPDGLGDLAREESDRFVRSVVASQGGLSELFTSTKTFVNADLARVYGLSGTFTSQFVEATLDGARRKGFLTQVGFLASNATAVNPDPIHRGVFIAKRLLCTHISAPPANAPVLPPANGRTNRQTVEAHTEQPNSVCVSCHGPTINPLGFPFESYDATGAYRTMDGNQPVNTVSDAKVGTEVVHVENALQLVDAIAASDAAHACYARHWLEFAYGRPSADPDENLIRRLGSESRAGTLSVRDLVLGLVKTEAFLTRSVEELP